MITSPSCWPNLVSPVAERAFRSGIELDDAAFVVDRHDAVERRNPGWLPCCASLSRSSSSARLRSSMSISRLYPADDMAVRISKRTSTRLKPAVDAIEASSAYFELEGFTRDDRPREDLDDAGEIFGMCGAAGSPLLELLLIVLPKYIENMTVHEFDLAAGRKGRDRPGNLSTNQA